MKVYEINKFKKHNLHIFFDNMLKCEYICLSKLSDDCISSFYGLQ